MRKYRGTGVSSGLAFGTVYVLSKQVLIPEKSRGFGAETERKRFLTVRETVAASLLALSKSVKDGIGQNESDIFLAHSRIAFDRTLERETVRLIEQEDTTAEWALYSAAAKICERLSAVSDPTIRGRVDDIRDVTGRMVASLMGNAEETHVISPGSILVADELLPSDTATLPKDCVVGFVTEKGGFTSHVVIMARALGIPAVVAVPGIRKLVETGDKITLDGASGEVIVSPDENALTEFNKRKEDYLRQKKLTDTYKTAETKTRDGKRLLVEANIGSLTDLETALTNGCEGVGLLRTEFLFMQSDKVPTEEEQFTFYSQCAQKLGNRPLIIRTLDIGGDKPIHYLSIEKEENPFLGMRAIRHSLRYTPLFIEQIRAILRAGCAGNVMLMLPMVTTLDELLAAKQLIAEAAQQLKTEKANFINVPVGIMIEVPSAAIMADVLAKHCDFFSIGTNDLIQYTLAVDRGNRSVAYLYNMYEPAVLRIIRHVIQCAHDVGIPVGMCGEAAANPLLVPVLVAMGLDAFSVSPPSVPQIRAAIHQTDTSQSVSILSQVGAFSSASEAEKHLSQNNCQNLLYRNDDQR